MDQINKQMYPYWYEKQRRTRGENEINEIKRKYDIEKMAVESSAKKRASSGSIADFTELGGTIGGIGGALFGGICGFLANIFVAIGGALLFGLIGFIAGKIIGLIAAPFARKRDNKIYTGAKGQKNSLDAECEAAVEEAYAEIERDIAEQAEAFAEEAQARSVDFAGDARTDAALDFVMIEIGRRIREADRSSYVKTITVSCDISVGKGHVDKFEFANMGFEVLNGNDVEVVALAQAVASELHLRTTMAFSQDPSGTEPTVKCTVDYSNLTIVHFTYSAQNGNYGYV